MFFTHVPSAARFCLLFHVGMVSRKLPEQLPIEKTNKKKTEKNSVFFVLFS
jgi:hypothetical protein